MRSVVLLLHRLLLPTKAFWIFATKAQRFIFSDFLTGTRRLEHPAAGIELPQVLLPAVTTHYQHQSRRYCTGIGASGITVKHPGNADITI